ncbi:MAG TPA: hypothetical protein VNZ26_11315, partial [Vicinamibacterales bacterium]|nr:hypothetical protein [Vicinamibacterales bacterium]
MRVLYLASDGRLGTLDEPRLEGTTERHLVALPPPPLASGEPIAELLKDPSLGFVLELATGCPTRRELALLARVLRLSRTVWLYWPQEGAVEVGTWERLTSYRRHRLVVKFYQSLIAPLVRLISIPRRLSYALRDMP